MSATSTDKLPQNLPAELAALGAPVQTFAPTAGQVNAHKLTACIGAAVSALMLFGMATFCFAMHHSPFSAKPWPPGVALGIALAAAAAVLAVSRRAGREPVEGDAVDEAIEDYELELLPVAAGEMRE